MHRVVTPERLAALVDDRPADGVFAVSREVFTDPELFALEMAHVFEGTWLFLGLESQIPRPHDFVTLHMGRQPVVLSRDADGRIRCFYNSCRHRGAMVVPWRSGNQRVHVCRYHGWTFDSGGRNVAVAQARDGQYHAAFDRTDHDLVPIAQLESYRGFVFGSLNPEVPTLAEHLGQARKFLDLVADQSPHGVEYLPGSMHYTFDGNWKLQLENGLDYYHFSSTHSAYMDVLQQRVQAGAAPAPVSHEAPEVPEGAGSWSLGNGHAMMYAIRKQGRVHARPLAKDPGAVDEIRARVGEDDTRWMLRQRNLTIFPNLQIVDISSQQLRTWRPLAPGRTEMTSHCLAPVGEGAQARAMRIRNYEDFFNPAGLASSDDHLMYEYLQSGYQAVAAGELQGYARGLGTGVVAQDPFGAELGLSPAGWAWGPVSFGDETCLHGPYREWMRLLRRGLKREGHA
ncbi:aromatic ring-hydroxylating dioxygenase subunit alpha [Ramlibacter sp. AN1015]|uniref:aromatic ring-hydroxylating oxygenase subunit alpha n=1 Tax=Ramlibacter sp. AN1015 TaxID=3133428 RepID=UPI0030C497B1